ncbi:MAG TPA: hypothetical protein VH858_13945 [Hyphomicrobiales bacterium]
MFCLAFCFLAAFGGASRAAGTEAAEAAEKLIEACQGKGVLSVQKCLNDGLNRKWRYELDYAGKPFSGVGRFENVRKSMIGNLFAFVTMGKYRVACKVTKRVADALGKLGGPRTVLVSGVLESYLITFNLHRLHHLRLTPYCSIEPAA